MASDSESVEFELGFVTDPDSEAQLNALAGAVMDTQKAISQSVATFADDTLASTARITTGAQEAIERLKGSTTRPLGPPPLAPRVPNRQPPQAQPAPSLLPETLPPGLAKAVGAQTAEGALLLDQLAQLDKKLGKGEKDWEEFSKSGNASVLKLEKAVKRLKDVAASSPEVFQQAFESGNINVLAHNVQRASEEVRKQKKVFVDLRNEYRTATADAAKYGKESQAAFAKSVAGITQTATGLATAGRGYVLLGGILEEHKTKVIGAAESTSLLNVDTVDLLAKIQGSIDVFGGAATAIGGMVKTIDGAVAFFKASALATTANTRATQAQIAVSRIRIGQLAAETAAVSALTASELALAAAKGRVVAATATAAASGIAGSAVGAGGAAAAAGAAGGGAAVAGGIVTASAGVIVAASAAAAAAIGFAGTSIYQFGKDVLQGGSTVGGYNDALASAEVSVISWLGSTTGFFDLLGQEGVDRLTKVRETNARVEAQQARIDSIRINAAEQRSRAEMEYARNLLDLNLSIADSSDQRTSLIQGGISDVGGKLQDNRAEQRQADQVDNQQKLNSLREQERGLVDAMLRLRQQERSEVEAGVRTKRQALLDEITQTEQILKNRLAEETSIENSLKSAGQRFVDLDPKARRQAETAFDEARRGVLLNKKGRDALKNIDTDEARRLLDGQYDREERRLGFRSKFGQSEENRLADINKKAKADRDKLAADAAKAGAAPIGSLAELRAELKINPTIEFVDKTQYEINTTAAVKAVSETIVGEMAKLYAGMQEAVRKAVDEKEGEAVQAANEEYGTLAQGSGVS